MATSDERNDAIYYLACNKECAQKADNAFSCAAGALARMKGDENLVNKFIMAMNIAYLTLCVEAIQLHYDVPASYIDIWIDAFVKHENRKSNEV